jgi:hypothetical protein
MNNQTNPADIFINTIKTQRNNALDLVALRDAEISSLKVELGALAAELEKMKNDNPEPA